MAESSWRLKLRQVPLKDGGETICDLYKVHFLDSSRNGSVVVLFVVLFVCLLFGEAGYDESQQNQFVG